MAEEPTRAEKLASFLGKSAKTYGEGVVTFVHDARAINVSRFSSGIFNLDLALGGGWPRRRMNLIMGKEGSGKTTTCVKACVELQKLSAATFLPAKAGEERCRALYVDQEGVLDEDWAQHLGFDSRHHVLARPNLAEEAVDLISAAMTEGVFDAIILDSIAACTPSRELEGGSGESNPGLQARIMNAAFRKWQVLINSLENPPTLFFVNQLREKIGVIHGCLHADTMIPLVDGRSFTIREIVDNKVEGEVFAYSEEGKKILPAKIKNWFFNGNVEKQNDFITITTEAVETKNGVNSVTCTPNHRVLTCFGWREAREIKVGDSLISKYSSSLNGTLLEFLSGTFIGDSHISIQKKVGYLKVQDKNNSEYVNWKVEKLSSLGFGEATCVLPRFSSRGSYELLKMKEQIGERNPLSLLSSFSSLSLAIWYMDDGCFDPSHNRGVISMKRFKGKGDILYPFISFLKETFDLEVTCHLDTGTLTLSGENFKKLNAVIYTFVPPCMQYKLLPTFRGGYREFLLESIKEIRIEVIKVTSIGVGSSRKFRAKGKYDLEIEGHHNYLAGNCTNGFIVHNSPETIPGGKGQYYSNSIHVRLSPIKTVDGEDKMTAFAEGGGCVKRNKTYVQGIEFDFKLCGRDDDGWKKGEFLNAQPLFKKAKSLNLIGHEWVTGRMVPDPEGTELKKKVILASGGDASKVEPQMKKEVIRVKKDEDMVEILHKDKELEQILWKQTLEVALK